MSKVLDVPPVQHVLKCLVGSAPFEQADADVRANASEPSASAPPASSDDPPVGPGNDGAAVAPAAAAAAGSTLWTPSTIGTAPRTAGIRKHKHYPI